MDEGTNELSKEIVDQLKDHFDLFCLECGCGEVEVGIKESNEYSIHEQHLLYFKCLACINIIELKIL